jgi:cell wall assembly regulator SMI1
MFTVLSIEPVASKRVLGANAQVVTYLRNRQMDAAVTQSLANLLVNTVNTVRFTSDLVC